MSAGGRDDTQSENARQLMVATQLEKRGIRDQRVLNAMRSVPRERFVPDAPLYDAYADGALPIPSGQTISQPYIVARMTELLAVEPGARVLEVGTGSGYQAAVLATLGCHVTSIERHESLAASARERLARLGYSGIEIVVGDGSLGWPAGAPWDGILVAAAAPSVPPSMRRQLGLRRRLVIPVGSREHQELLVVERVGESEWTERSDGPCVFVPLVGAEGFPA